MRLTAKINFINQAHANITIWQDGGNTGTNTVSACCAQQFVDYINDYDESVLVNQAKVEGTIADAERTADHAEAVAEHGLTGDCNVETYPAPEPLVDPFTCLADCITVMGRAIMAINPPHTLAQIAVQTATRLLPEMRDLDDQKNRDNAEFRRETAEKYTGMDTTPYDAVERAMEPEKGPA